MPPTNSVHSLKEIDAEKHEMVPIEVARGQNEHISAVDADFLAGFTNEQRRRVLRKVDWRLVPMLLILYLISFNRSSKHRYVEASQQHKHDC